MAQIAFEAVTKSYPDAPRPAVNEVSFTVPEGIICMLLGTSGSGKTTLLRMVNRLIDPTSGTISIDGTPTTAQDPIALRRRIGYAIQQVGLFPHLTVAENIWTVPSITGMPKEGKRSRVDELLDLVGLPPAEYRDRYPRQLSGGQQQRVGLARALAADPAILLMDEPFGALDAITRERLQGELVRIQRSLRKTVLFVTHDVEEAFRLGDRVAVMNEGQLMQYGTPVELLAAPANDFVSRLVGAENVVRQLQYLPVTLAAQPLPTGEAPSEVIGADSTLLDALLRLLQSGDTGLRLDRPGQPDGQREWVTLQSIYAELQASRQSAAPSTASARLG